MAIRTAVIVWMILLTANASVTASDHYTDKQLDALASRVGKIYWINVNSQNPKPPTFLSTPAANAPTFSVGGNESFEITDLAGRANKDPYYKVKFESGKVGYIRPDVFLEEFNVTILSIDPKADEKKHLEEQAGEEQKRVEWIKAQPWSPAVKEAAIKKQPTPGLNAAEVKRVLGTPRRVTRLRGLAKVSEEHWFYADGSVLIFNNGLLSRVEKAKTN
ncbi:MAG TPA: hypothetical protein VH985_01670 [Candidatus Binatia bacterium]